MNRIRGPKGILRLRCLGMPPRYRKLRSGKALSANKRESMVLGWMLDRLLDSLKEWREIINSGHCPLVTILRGGIIFTVPRCLWISFSSIQRPESRLRQATTSAREPHKLQVLLWAYCLLITTRIPSTWPIQPSGGIWVLFPTSLKLRERNRRNLCRVSLRATTIGRIQPVLTTPKIISSRLPSLHSSVRMRSIRRPRRWLRSRALYWPPQRRTRRSTRCSSRPVVAKVNSNLILPGGRKLKGTQHSDQKRGALRPTSTRVLSTRASRRMEQKLPRVAGKPRPWLADPSRALSNLMLPTLCQTLLSMIKDNNRRTSQVRRK